MKKTILALTLGLACVTAGAQASEWKFLTTGKNKIDFYTRNVGMYKNDKTTLKFVWVKYVNPDKTFTMARHEFNCEYESTSIKDSTLYSENGTIIGQNPYEPNRIVKPNTIDELLLRGTCLE